MRKWEKNRALKAITKKMLSGCEKVPAHFSTSLFAEDRKKKHQDGNLKVKKGALKDNKKKMFAMIRTFF